MKFGILEIRVKIFEEDEVFERVDRELHLPNKKNNVVGPLPWALTKSISPCHNRLFYQTDRGKTT